MKIKKVIFPYKIFPGWKLPHESDSSFLDLAELAIEQAKKYYEVVLVADKLTITYFGNNDLLDKFSKVEESVGIENYKGQSYGVPKMLAMMEQTEPYIMLDFDSILLKELPDVSDITFGFPDVDFTKESITEGMINYCFNVYYNKKEIDMVKALLPENYYLDWKKLPNSSLVMVPDPNVITNVYVQILENFESIIEIISPMLTEQFLLAQYLRLKGHPYKFLQKTYGAEDSALQTAYFLHWGKHDNDNNLLLKLLRERYMKKQVI